MKKTQKEWKNLLTIMFVLVIVLIGFEQIVKQRRISKNNELMKKVEQDTKRWEQREQREQREKQEAERQKVLKRRTLSMLRRDLRGKSMSEAIKILGKKPQMISPREILSDPNGGLMHNRDKDGYIYGESWTYNASEEILWNPIIEDYEGVYIQFVNGRFHSLVRSIY